MADDKKIEEPRKFTPEFFENEKTPDVSEDGGYWDADGYYYEKEGFYDPDGNYFVYDDAEEELENVLSEAKIAPPLSSVLSEKEEEPVLEDTSDNTDTKKTGIKRFFSKKTDSKKPGSKKPKTKMDPRKQKKMIAIIVVAAAVVILAGSLIYYFGFVKSKDNYDAQMKIGTEHFNAKEYAEAEAAFLRALEYKPDDLDATIALSDTFEAQEKYDKSLTLLKGLVDKGGIDKRLFSRLYSIYIEKLGDEASIAAANELTLYCYENGLDPSTELIPAVPKFSPNGGTFNIATEFTITAGEGLTIYYTMDGSNPAVSGVLYEKALLLKENKADIVIMAVARNELGLVSLPIKTTFTIDIQFSADAHALDNIGATNKEISAKVGALFYKGYEEGGYYYSTKTGDVLYIFPAESFNSVPTTDPITGAPVTVDPETTPLPPEAVCSAVSMKTKKYVIGMTENVKAADFAHGLAVEKYEVVKLGKEYTLDYNLDGLHYSFTMKDKETVSVSGDLLVKKG